MVTRREFVVATGAAAAAACGGGGSSPGAPNPAPSSPPAPTPSPGPTTNQLRLPLPAVGETVAATGQLLSPLPLAVTRLSPNAVAAVSRICTHEACTVDLPVESLGSLDCPCHGSRYTVQGQVLRGPAVRALASFPTVIEGAQVVITLPQT